MPTTKWAELNEDGLVLCKADQAIAAGLRLGIAYGAQQPAFVLKSGTTDQTAYLVAKVTTADAATGDEIASAKFVGDKVSAALANYNNGFQTATQVQTAINNNPAGFQTEEQVNARFSYMSLNTFKFQTAEQVKTAINHNSNGFQNEANVSALITNHALP